MPVAPPPNAPAGHSWRAFMDIAFEEACLAAREGESPVGAALFAANGDLLARAHNRPIAQNDPTSHAEVLCLRQAASAVGNYRLPGTILAVTLEPCLMCTGALLHARVAGVLFGAPDPRAGALVTNLNGRALPFTNHELWTIQGIMEAECAALLRRFFLEKRKA